MHMSLASLCLCLVVLVCEYSGRPMTVDMIRTSVKQLTKTTVVHIKKLRGEFQVAPGVGFGQTSDPPIKGLTSIAANLEALEGRLQCSPPSQVQADVSHLRGLVCLLALELGCTIQAMPRGEAQQSAFPITQSYLVLVETQHYLEKLSHSLDMLKTC